MNCELPVARRESRFLDPAYWSPVDVATPTRLMWGPFVDAIDDLDHDPLTGSERRNTAAGPVQSARPYQPDREPSDPNSRRRLKPSIPARRPAGSCPPGPR